MQTKQNSGFHLPCHICKGKGLCGKPCIILSKLKIYRKKIKTSMQGTSPPEVFVGRHNYPNVFAGTLASPEEQNFEEFTPEAWVKKNFSIGEIIAQRTSMFYGRSIVRIKKPDKIAKIIQETSMAKLPARLSMEFKKRPKPSFNFYAHWPMIGNPAPLKSLKIEENIKVERKVDYLVEDTDIKASEALIELYRSKININYMIRLLSAGLLGLKFQRKLVPTRWAITACDATISENLLKKIREYPPIDKYLLFRYEYVGNHYEILLIPEKWSFEVIEAKLKGSVWAPEASFVVSDYEDFFSKSFFSKKEYAKNVTGAYYANKLAVLEFLKKIKRQASCLVLREVKPEYWAPCGVGILREAVRKAFENMPSIFASLKEALEEMERRIPNLKEYVKKSKLLKKLKTQKKLISM